MEHLNNSLGLIVKLEECLTNGESVQSAMIRFCKENKGDFSRLVMQLLGLFRQNASTMEFFTEIRNSYQLSVLELCFAGLNGQSILQKVSGLRRELEEVIELDVRRHIESLPLKILVPLVLCQFPAILILLFGPLVRQFLNSLGGM